MCEENRERKTCPLKFQHANFMQFARKCEFMAFETWWKFDVKFLCFVEGFCEVEMSIYFEAERN